MFREGRRAGIGGASLLLLVFVMMLIPERLVASTDSGMASNHGTATDELLVGLMLILVGAKLAGELFERIRQPPVLGELLFGVILGNLDLFGFGGIDYIRSDPAILALSQIGVILLLFEVGLESNLTEMRRSGASSFLVAVLGVVAPMGLGWGVGAYFLPNEPTITHVFIGATLCATSVGITARVLRDLGQLRRSESRIILGAAVIDDVLGLLVLAVLSGLIAGSAAGGGLDIMALAEIFGKALAFLLGAVYLGRFGARTFFRWASFLQIKHMLLVTSLAFCFLLARLASLVGLAHIVGAFAAGLILDPVHYRDFRDRGEHTIEELIHPIGGFLVPVFFVVTGMNVDLGAIADPSVLGFAGVLTLVAVIGKQVCALGVLERGVDRLSVGLGMIPRGEVGLIFANMGLALQIRGSDGQLHPVVSPAIFGSIVFVVILTTLATPSLLKWSLVRSDRESIHRDTN